MRRYLLVGLVGLGVAALVLWAFLPRAISVETAAIAPRDLSVEIEAEGEARIREVFIVSAPIAGKLQRIELHPGDTVLVGDTVAQIGPAAPALLDSRSRAMAEAAAAAAGAAVDLAHAQLAQAEATRDYAVTEADRTRALYERSTLSKRVLENAVLAQRTAEAAVESARANLSVREQERESARAVLAGGDSAADDCCVAITTPVAGRILRVGTEDEQIVQPGMPILEIGDPANLEIAVELLSRDSVRVAVGAEATISGWGGADLAATVERVEPAAVTKVSALGIEEQRVEVILSLTGDPSEFQILGHGFRILARIRVWEEKGVLSIPVGALFRNGSNWAAYVVQDGRATLRMISIGERNEAFAQVLDGLTEGEVVILHPSDAISAGIRVQEIGG